MKQVKFFAAAMLIAGEDLDVLVYAVNISAGIEHGTVTADKAKATAGETVTLTVTPAGGYQIASVTVDGEPLEAVESVYSFVMPAKAVTVAATFSVLTAIDNTSDELKAVKRIENGMLIIEKNGVRYNAQGQVVR